MTPLPAPPSPPSRSTSPPSGAATEIAAAASELGSGADILVNNAGVSTIRAIEDVPLDDWRAAYELNVIAPKLLMDATVPSMAERGWGRVVNVASTAGKRPSSNMPEYSVAKAAQLSLSRLYADRWAPEGVAINAVCPGPVKSEMWMDEGGLLDQTVATSGAADRDAALAARRLQAPDRPPRRGRGDRFGDRLPLLPRGLLRLRRGLERRRRHACR